MRRVPVSLASVAAASLIALSAVVAGCTVSTGSSPSQLKSRSEGSADGGAAVNDGGAGNSARNDGGSAAPDASGASPAGTDVTDPTELLNIVRGYHASSHFVEMSSAPYASTAAAGVSIAVWVSSQAYDAYTEITPDTTGSRAALPVGSVIVREVLDAQGALTKITMMFKGPAGYNPALGDWGFAVTDRHGAMFETDAGPMFGPMSECYSCHLARSNDDFLFGVPTFARAPHP